MEHPIASFAICCVTNRSSTVTLNVPQGKRLSQCIVESLCMFGHVPVLLVSIVVVRLDEKRSVCVEIKSDFDSRVLQYEISHRYSLRLWKSSRSSEILSTRDTWWATVASSELEAIISIQIDPLRFRFAMTLLIQDVPVFPNVLKLSSFVVNIID